MVKNIAGLLLLLAVVSVCQAYYYNYYVFAQQWPASFCFEDNSYDSSRSKFIRESCHFAKNITSWTNHGLWPSVNETYPNFCNSSWELEEADILTLEDTMRAKWPSFAGPDISFWQHEWVKHGTCATQNPLLYGPMNYFKFALNLNQKYDIMGDLKQALNIIPEDSQCYEYSDFLEATRKLYNESVILGCTWDKQAKQQHIAQIEICFDKRFGLTCDPSFTANARPRNYGGPRMYAMPEVEPCRSSEQICYTTIDH